MAWISKVSQHDYVARLLGHGIVIDDRRNKKSYPLSANGVREIREKFGVCVTSTQVIEYCINQAVIPHPFEEYV